MNRTAEFELLAANFETKAKGEVVPERPNTDAMLASNRRRLATLLGRLARRKMEALVLYVAIARAIAFHQSRALTRLLDASNQSGKTLAAAIEFVRAITGSDPYVKYQPTGSALVVGFDEKHIANPMWKTIAEPGAFSLIRDEHTNELRSVRMDPNAPSGVYRLDPYDEAYREKWQEAPPLLPPRCIKKLVWKDAGLRVPASITTTAGWQVEFRSSKTDPKRGSQIDFWWFDEEIRNTMHLPEAYRGCMRRGGVGVWSATAQSGGRQLYQLYQKSQAAGSAVERFPLYIAENPFFTAENKQAFYDSLTERERNVRWFGNYEIIGQFVYGVYDPQGDHGCEPFAIPPDWSIEVTVDPGGQRQGCIIGAIDPEEKHAWVADGFDLRQADAQQWAQEVKSRLHGRRPYRYIIDQQMGRQSATGQGRAATVARTYFAAVRKAGISPYVEGPLNGFFPGSNDVQGRETILKDWLAIRGDGPHHGTPMLQVMRGRVPALDQEMQLAQRQVDRPDKRELWEEDCLVTLEYWAASDPRYHRPAREQFTTEPTLADRLQDKQERLQQNQPKSTGVPGMSWK